MIIYRERVLPSAGNLALPAILFFTVLAIMLPINSDFAAAIALVISLAFLALMFVSAPVIELTEHALTCRGASIDRKFIGEIKVIEKTEKFAELGMKLDARAWLSIQSSVAGLVRLGITDPEDQTPYWLVSSRKPETLVKLLKNA